MSLSNPYAQYRTTQVATASHEKMIVMLHDSAIRSLQQALPALQAHDYYTQNQTINKALAVLAHMRGSLRMDSPTDLTSNLDSLYGYFLERLTHANIHNETAPVEEAIRFLRSHREAWAEVARLATETAHASDARPSGETALGSLTSRDLSLAV